MALTRLGVTLVAVVGVVLVLLGLRRGLHSGGSGGGPTAAPAHTDAGNRSDEAASGTHTEVATPGAVVVADKDGWRPILAAPDTPDGSPINNTFAVRDSNHTLPVDVQWRIAQSWAQSGAFETARHHPNVTALFRGHWRRDTTTVEMPAAWREPAANGSDSAHPRIELTGTEGALSFSWNSNATAVDNVHLLQGNLRVRDDGASGVHPMFNVQGVYFLDRGLVLAVGTTLDHSLIRHLPFLMPTEAAFHDADRILADYLAQLQTRVARGEVRLTKHRGPAKPVESCTLYGILQLTPLPASVTAHDMRVLELEMTAPEGRSTVPPPPLIVDGFLFSPDCDWKLAVNGTGMRLPVVQRKAVHFAAGVIATSLAEVYLALQQVQHTRSHSTVVRVSLWMVALQVVLDAYYCLFLLTAGVVFDEVFVAFTIAAFLKFMVFFMVEMRYLLRIWVTSRPAAANPDAMRRELAIMFAVFYGSLVNGIVLFYEATGGVARWLGVLLHAFWLPQIVHSFRTGARQPLSRVYIVGMSVVRLYIPLYFVLYTDNIVGMEPSPSMALALVTVMAVLAAVLLLQDRFGARFFLGDQHQPKRYNYYVRVPPPPPGDVEAGGGAASEEVSCLICMSPIDLAAVHMETPCHHRFHSACLETWMRMKPECPTCRARLPVD